MHINLHYGPCRIDALRQKGAFVDHPFARSMPEEMISMLDSMLETNVDATVDIILVEEYPMTYLRYLLRKKRLEAGSVKIFWYEHESVRELRLGNDGELLDPWPTGHFDRSLEFVLGGF